MMDGLHNSLGEIFPLFFRITSLSMSGQSPENHILLSAVLEALVAFIGWVPHS